MEVPRRGLLRTCHYGVDFLAVLSPLDVILKEKKKMIRSCHILSGLSERKVRTKLSHKSKGKRAVARSFLINNVFKVYVINNALCRVIGGFWCDGCLARLLVTCQWGR